MKSAREIVATGMLFMASRIAESPARVMDSGSTDTLVQAPNVYAIQSWLYNRRPDKWCKNPEQRITLESDDTVSIVVTRAGNDETGTRPGLDESVNTSVTVRGMTDEEKEAQRKKKRKAKDEVVVDKDSVDYWPDDWEDD